MAKLTVSFIVTAALFLTTSGFAQISSGTILGAVTDQTGALIPGANIIVTDQATRYERRTVTDNAGNFVVEELSPGLYAVAVTKEGFKQSVTQGISLTVASRTRVDVRLEVGAPTQTVSVQATAPVIKTDEATIGELIGSTAMKELPLNGRNFLQIATLTPGVQSGNEGYMSFFGGSISSNGSSDTSTFVRIDGVDNLEPDGERMDISPNPDMIQEFKLSTNTYDAEYGKIAGAQVTIVTKRGTLAYHGSLYEFLRNNDLDSRTFFQQGALSEFRQNQFGGTFGGPIPRSQKDFFFFSYEGMRQLQGIPPSLMTWPTSDLRSGDFSATGTTIYDPLTYDPTTGTRQPFPNDMIPKDRLSPQALVLQGYIPVPNIPGAGYTNNYSISPKQTEAPNQWSIRYDRDFSPKDTVNVRFTRNSSAFLVPNGISPFATPVPGFGETGNTGGDNAGISWDHIFGGSAVNSLRLGFTRFFQDRINQTTGSDWAAKAGITGISPANATSGFPYLSIGGFTGLSDDFVAPQLGYDQSFVLQDILSKVVKHHSMRIGGDFNYTRYLYTDDAVTRGAFGPDGGHTTSAAYGAANMFNNYADFLLGDVGGGFYNDAPITGDSRAKWNSLFFQDNWTVSKSLTLNLGLRWQVYHRPIEAHNRMAGLDLLGTGDFLFPNVVPNSPFTPPNSETAAAAGFPNSLGDHTRYGDMEPRFGFAWRMFGSDKTVLRGGFGVFHSYTTIDQQVLLSSGPPFVNSGNITDNPLVPTISLADPYEPIVPGAPSGGNVIVNDNHTPYMEQYSMGVERELSPTWGAEVNFVGNAARHVPYSYQYNQPVPGPGDVTPRLAYPQYASGNLTAAVTWAVADYSALQATIRRKAKGLWLLGSYTWANSLGEANAGPVWGGGENVRDYRNWKADYGPLPFDLRQSFSLGWVADVPFGKGRRFAGNIGSVADGFLGGWEFSGITTAHTGDYETVSDINNTSNSGNSRPDIISNPNGLSHSSRAASLQDWFNTAAFQRAPLFTFGDEGVGTVEGPGFFDMDLALYKNFNLSALREGMKLQFRAESFNTPNRPNFGDPATTYGAGNFGVIGGTTGIARQIQFGLRLDF